MENDAKAILRAQVEIELHNKRQCSYEPYQCSHLSVEGSKYCVKHILNDKNAQYKQCNFTYQNNGKRCHLPTPRGDKKEYGYCKEHALKSTLSRNKQNAKNPPPLSAESLLTNLSHYVKKPRNRSASSSSFISDEERNHGDDIGETRTIRSIDPFVDVDANAVYNEQCNEVLDMCSESESDVEPSTYASVWHDANADSSDNESIDSEDEDPLKHANVYTTEEISLLTRDKLVRLQSLYIEEYKHLRYLLKERRRKFIHSLKREKETCCNIYNQVRDNPKEQRLYQKLKHYNKYHKVYGQEAILDKRLHDLRAKISEGAPVKSTSFPRCQFTEGGVKCGERSLPMAKHCRKHILEDPNQILFKACGKVNADVECNTPVEAIFEDSTCKLHMDIPPIRSYSHPRKEADTDSDDTLDLPPHFAVPPTNNVKTEMIDYSLPPLPKMETLPSILFEDSAESLSSTLQYSTSEFTECFAEQSSIDVPETARDPEINFTEIEISDNKGLETDETNVESNIAIDESDLLNLNSELESEPTNKLEIDLLVQTKDDEETIMENQIEVEMEVTTEIPTENTEEHHVEIPYQIHTENNDENVIEQTNSDTNLILSEESKSDTENVLYDLEDKMDDVSKVSSDAELIDKNTDEFVDAEKLAVDNMEVE